MDTGKGASPGQAYLLQRKIEGERKLELRNVIRAVAQETYTTLAEYADDAVHDPIGHNDNDTHAVLNASFLVATTQYDYFRRALTDLVIHYQHAGFQFDFTGPWPPYHFVHGN